MSDVYKRPPQLHSYTVNSSCESSCNTQVFPRNHLTIANINFARLRTITLATDSHQTISILPLIIKKTRITTTHLTMARLNFTHQRSTRLAKTLVTRKYFPGIILRLQTSTSHVFGQLLLLPTLIKPYPSYH